MAVEVVANKKLDYKREESSQKETVMLLGDDETDLVTHTEKESVL